jgi:nucleotide-binding universal stress UspA family protein
VIVGFDGSPGSRHAVRWAVYEAMSRQAVLFLLRAFSLPPGERGERFAVRWRPEAEREVAAIAGECRREAPELELRTEIRMGNPAATLAEAAAGAELLVLGAPAMSGTRAVLLGSTSAELVRRLNVPVVVVRGERESRRVAENPRWFERVVVGVNGSQTSVRAIGFAYDFASRHDSELVAVHAWDELPPDALSTAHTWQLDWADIDDACRRELSEAMAGWQERYPNVPVRKEVTTAQRPAEALFTAAEEADLLVVGSHGRGVVRTVLLGSVSHAVMHYAPCPVAVVR